jgi:hypothetical protein
MACIASPTATTLPLLQCGTGEVVDRVAADLARGVLEDLRHRVGVVGVQLAKHGEPLLRTHRTEAGPVGGGPRDVGEPVHLAVVAHEVTEERTPPEHHVLRVGSGREAGHAREAAEADESGVRGRRGIRVDVAACRRPDPVGSDEEVASGGAAVGEDRVHGGIRLLDAFEAGAEPDRDIRLLHGLA